MIKLPDIQHLSLQRVREIAEGATPLMGEVQRLAVTALGYVDENKSSIEAFQSTGFLLLEREKELEEALAEVQRLNATAQPVSEHNGKVADALESLLWPNMASGNKDIINEAVRALRATSAQSLSDDTRRMDYLVSKVVNVREPLLYGSHSILWSEEITDEEDDHYENRLREQIDALLAMRPGGQNE